MVWVSQYGSCRISRIRELGSASVSSRRRGLGLGSLGRRLPIGRVVDRLSHLWVSAGVSEEWMRFRFGMVEGEVGLGCDYV